MKNDMIFFSPAGKGLTSTSANHIANLAKEMIRNLTSELDNMVFYATDVTLIGNENKNRLINGVKAENVEAISDKLFRIAKAKSLIAWLREAIKAKEAMIDEAKSLTLEKFSELKEIKLEDAPHAEPEMTEEEYVATMDVDKRCRYYEIETLASTLGKEIHPGGSFAKAREELMKVIDRPHSVKGEGRDTLLYTYTPSVSTDVVDDAYFRLQKLFREAQSEVNTLKYECRRSVTDENIARSVKFNALFEEWKNNRRMVEEHKNEYIKRRVKELGELKILIPPSLYPIYEEVSRLGKKD